MGIWKWLFGPPSRHRFAQQIIAGLKRAQYPYEIRYDQAEFRLLFTEGGTTRGFAQLHNIYHEHCLTPKKDRKNHLRRLIRSKLRGDSDIPEEFEDARPDILPVIRSRAYFELTPLQARVEGLDFPSPPYQPLAEHLGIGLVYDLPESMVSLNQPQLAKWDVNFYQAYEAGLENLRELPLKAVAQLGDGLYSLMTYDNYDASRILLSEVLEQLELDGPPVALIAHRDCVLVTGAHDDKSLVLLSILAEKELENPRAISGIPICLQDEEWSDWLPHTDHASYPQFKLLQLQTLARHYVNQQELLNKQYSQSSAGLFVSTYHAIRKSDQEAPFSYSVWSEGVPCLLPETDWIFFMTKGADTVTLQAPWSAVAGVLEGFLEPVDDLYPRRFRVTSFPDPQQMAQLKQWNA